jgi:hypothetical protein
MIASEGGSFAVILPGVTTLGIGDQTSVSSGFAFSCATIHDVDVNEIRVKKRNILLFM